MKSYLKRKSLLNEPNNKIHKSNSLISFIKELKLPDNFYPDDSDTYICSIKPETLEKIPAHTHYPFMAYTNQPFICLKYLSNLEIKMYFSEFKAMRITTINGYDIKEKDKYQDDFGSILDWCPLFTDCVYVKNLILINLNKESKCYNQICLLYIDERGRIHYLILPDNITLNNIINDIKIEIIHKYLNFNRLVINYTTNLIINLTTGLDTNLTTDIILNMNNIKIKEIIKKISIIYILKNNVNDYNPLIRYKNIKLSDL